MRSSHFSFKGQTSLYVFVAVLFLVGVIFGALMVNALSLEQRQDLEGYLGNFFVTVHHGTSGGETGAYWDIAMLHLKWIGLIWILGLSVIGLPGILVLDFMKGVLIGFTVGYLVGQYSWKGLLFALVSVAPHNLFVIPILLVCSVAAMTFSIYIIRNRLLAQRSCRAAAVCLLSSLDVGYGRAFAGRGFLRNLGYPGNDALGHADAAARLA